MEKGKGGIFSIPLDCILPINHLPKKANKAFKPIMGRFAFTQLGICFTSFIFYAFLCTSTRLNRDKGIVKSQIIEAM